MKNIVERIVVILTITTLISSGMLQAESPDNNEGVTGTPEGWSEDMPITNYIESDRKVNIACREELVHLVWERYIASPAGYEIFYTSSMNSGKTWIEPIQLSENDFSVFNPDISASNSSVHVVWNERASPSNRYEIVYRHSTDGGQSWLPEQMISANDGNHSEAPKIAVSEDGMGIHVVWVDSRHGGESIPDNTELYYNRSLDGGITWEGERRLTNALYYSSYHQIAIEGSTVHILWSDARTGVTSGNLYYKVSYDNGENWSSDILLAGTPNSEINGAIAVNGSMIHVVWVEISGSDYNLYYQNSTNNGISWGTSQLLVGPLPGSSYRPQLTTYHDVVHMVWMDMRDDGSTREIYYKNSTDAGANWNPDLRLTYSPGTNSW